LTLVARVVAFIVGCAVLLAVSNAISQTLIGTARQLATGAIAAIGAFALTWLFTRRDKLALADVGAKPTPSSPLRFLIGTIFGPVLVSVWAAIYALSGYVQWSRQRDFGFATLPMAFLALSCREELAFHG
jgi:hypothetical protein